MDTETAAANTCSIVGQVWTYEWEFSDEAIQMFVRDTIRRFGDVLDQLDDA